MEPLLIKSCSVDRPGVLTLRGYPNERQPWTPTPRLVVDVHTICWYTIGVAYSLRIPPTVIALPDHGDAVRCESGYILPFTVGTSFGVIQIAVVVSADARGEYVPQNTDLISELIHQFNGVL
ncbi:MAG: hypothetical protein EKK55_11700 [Rhodocyclaceae bacterium]|nr:MAG: hypothetical protein EKK55_11700 [Rhodocyclaceae bacterium]